MKIKFHSSVGRMERIRAVTLIFGLESLIALVRVVVSVGPLLLLILLAYVGSKL